jgi:hypothetical protein
MDIKAITFIRNKRQLRLYNCYSQFQKKTQMKMFHLLALTVLTFNVQGQGTTTNLKSEMIRLKTETALLVQSQAIDEYPLWSPNSDFVACNIMGKWYKFRMTNIQLTEAKWRGQVIGVLTTKEASSEMTESEHKAFDKVSKFNPREVKTKNGTIIELKETGNMSVSLIVTKKGEKSKALWTSEGENCHSLVVSPDEKYVAYLCEMNGLLVMGLE